MPTASVGEAADAPVDLWAWRLAGGEAGWLSPDEAARAGQFAFPRDRDRYVAGRARLREVLGLRLGLAPEAVRFRYNRFGRPEVDGLSFSLAHSEGLALLAVGPPGLPLGVDLELVRPLAPDLARAGLAPAEARALEALPPIEQAPAFFRAWTRKEAYLKARGVGLSVSLASFEVTLGPDEPARLLRCDSGDAAAWQLLDLDLGPGLTAALAARWPGPLMPRWRARP